MKMKTRMKSRVGQDSRVRERCASHLTGGEAPGDHQRLLQERRVDAEVATHSVQAEQVAVDAFAHHRVAVQVLVVVARPAQQRHALLALHAPVQVQSSPSRVRTREDADGNARWSCSARASRSRNGTSGSCSCALSPCVRRGTVASSTTRTSGRSGSGPANTTRGHSSLTC